MICPSHLIVIKGNSRIETKLGWTKSKLPLPSSIAKGYNVNKITATNVCEPPTKAHTNNKIGNNTINKAANNQFANPTFNEPTKAHTNTIKGHKTQPLIKI